MLIHNVACVVNIFLKFALKNKCFFIENFRENIFNNKLIPCSFLWMKCQWWTFPSGTFWQQRAGKCASLAEAVASSDVCICIKAAKCSRVTWILNVGKPLGLFLGQRCLHCYSSLSQSVQVRCFSPILYPRYKKKHNFLLPRLGNLRTGGAVVWALSSFIF